jgi:hypothetical protein
MRLVVCALALVPLAAVRPATACSCAAAPLPRAFEGAPVIIEADVASVERRDAAAWVGRATVRRSYKGAVAGAKIDVHFRQPDGKSCDLVALSTGRWLLFLSRLDGDLWVARCDSYSRKATGPGAAELIRKLERLSRKRAE